MSNPVPQQAFPPGAPPPRKGPAIATRLVVVLLSSVLVLGYLLAVFLTGQFDADSAHQLADTLNRGASPVSLSFESLTDEILPATTLSKVLRVAEIAAGVGLTAIVLGALVYLARSRQRGS